MSSASNCAVGTVETPVAAVTPPPETPAPAAPSPKAEPVVVQSLGELDWKAVLSRFAWLKLLSAQFFTLVVLAATAFISILFVITANKGHPISPILFIVTLVMIVATVGTIYYILTPKLSNVWKNKIRGTNLICSYNKTDQSLSYYFLPRGQKPKDYDIALTVPVKGWFSDPRILVKNDEWSYIRFTGHWRISAPVSRYLQSNAAPELELRLKDWDENVIQLDVARIMKIISRFSGLRDGGVPNARWNYVLASILRSEAERGDKFLEAVAEGGRLFAAHSSDLDLILETIKRLDATKRFIQSEEARGIREWLVAELEKRLPPDDQRRKNYIFDAVKPPVEAGATAS